MTDKLEQVIRQLTAVNTKLEMVCSRVDALVEKLDKDHDILIRLDSKVYSLECWKRDHEKEHYDIQKKFRAIDEELDRLVQKIKGVETFIEETKFRRLAWISLASALAGGFAGGLITLFVKLFGG